MTENGTIGLALAAGLGKRMNSDMPKVMHEAGGKAMVLHCADLMAELGLSRSIIVLGHKSELVRAILPPGVEVALQPEQKGTGHAVMCAAPLIENHEGTLLLLYGDVPLLRADTLRALMREHSEKGAAATVLTTFMDDPSGYGRVVRGKGGLVEKIVEHKDASPGELQIKEINSGIYCFNNQALMGALKKLTNNNAQGEYYVTDTISILREAGGLIAAVVAADPCEVMGVNNLDELAFADRVLRSRGLPG